MSVNKFGFGDLSFKLLSGAKFAGNQVKHWGTRKIGAGYFEQGLDYTYGFGEIVEIAGDNEKNYVVKPISSATADTATLAVIMNEITGATTIHQGTINAGDKHVPLNLWLLVRENMGTVSVPVVESDTVKVEIGGKVYIGTGADGTIAGSAYAENVTGTIAREGLVFTSKAGKPTAANGLTAAIGFGL